MSVKAIIGIIGALALGAVVLGSLSSDPRERDIQAHQVAEVQRLVAQAADDRDAARVKRHEAWVGMTADQLRKSWGEPEWGNRTVTASTTRDQWHYQHRPFSYVYLENGTVTALQQ